ncbi:MAG: F0F1 ATP synthase subunit B [Candidatus Peregrinibacteria bacterium]
MEALSNLGIDFKVLIAQIINFGILLFVLIKVLYKPILNALEARQKKIAESLKKAEEIDRKATAAEEDRQKKLASAKKEAQQLLEEAKHDAEITRRDLVASAEDEARRLKASAEKQIMTEKAELYKDAKHHVSKLALLLMTKAFRHDQGEDFYKKNVDAALKDMEKVIS